MAPTSRLVDALTPVVGERMAAGRAQLASYSHAELALIRDFLRTTRQRHATVADQLRRGG